MQKYQGGVSSQEDRLVDARVSDALSAAKKYSVKFVGFLDPHEAIRAQKCAAALCAGGDCDGCSFTLFGGYEGAERVFLAAFPPYSEPGNGDFPIAPIEITWRFASLSHRDFLGALLALGIMRNKIGDIVVGDGKCTVFAEKTVASFIAQNLVKVGAAGVSCRICKCGITEDGGFALPDIQFHEINTTVASQRLDCVVSVLAACSRSAAAELIAGGLVSVNFEICCDNCKNTEVGATVSIRSHGRFIIDRLGPQTKKGRLSFSARKYL